MTKRTIALANYDVATEAALYFDEVLPIHENISDEFLEKLGLGVFSGWSNLVYDAVWGLGKGTQADEMEAFFYYDELEERLGADHPEVIAEGKRLDYREKAWRDIYLLPHLKHWLEVKVPCLNVVPVFSHGFPERPKRFPENFLYEGFPSFYQVSNESCLNCLELEIIGSGIIDGSKLEWDHVLDIRHDKESMKKLRNFRLFIDGDLKDKPSEYIHDRLDQKMEEYLAVCQKHKLDLIEATYSSLIESKAALATVLLSVMSVITGAKDIASLVAGSGAIATVAGAALKLSPKLYEYKKAKDTHEVAYLFDIRNRQKK